jgi:hypothetical protein
MQPGTGCLQQWPEGGGKEGGGKGEGVWKVLGFQEVDAPNMRKLEKGAYKVVDKVLVF